MSDSLKEIKQEQPKTRSSKPIYFIIIAALIVLLVVKVVLDQKEKAELTEYYQTELQLSKIN